MTNKKFNSLTKAEKRVAVAKDVLAQIAKKVYYIRTGSYVDTFSFGNGDDVKEILDKGEVKECRVCAIGSLILSTTRYCNILKGIDITTHAVTGKGGMSDNLRKVVGSLFTPSQLLMIEEAFEGKSEHDERFAENVFQFRRHLSNKRDECDRIHELYDDDEGRLVFIMKNIIKNKGTFKP